jgi:hypothetical protein
MVKVLVCTIRAVCRWSRIQGCWPQLAKSPKKPTEQLSWRGRAQYVTTGLCIYLWNMLTLCPNVDYAVVLPRYEMAGIELLYCTLIQGCLSIVNWTLGAPTRVDIKPCCCTDVL